jgi:Ca2+-binding EF-hand superfamily protein
VQASAPASAAMETEVRVQPEPEEPPVSAYFQLIVALDALDTNHDNVISAAEIANAPAALNKIDRNHDGKLIAEECGLRLPNANSLDARSLRRARLRFMRIHPVLAALDADHNGEISASELQRAAAALKTLDRNGDGKLTEDEILPHALTSPVDRFLSALDKEGFVY